MEENQTQETLVEQASTTPLTPEQQMSSLKGLAKMKHKAYANLITLHMRNILADILDTRASQKNRVVSAKALEDIVIAVLDMGVDIINPVSNISGAPAKKAAQFGGVLAQAFDNKMLLLAQKMSDEANGGNMADKVEVTSLSAESQELVKNNETGEEKNDNA